MWPARVRTDADGRTPHKGARLGWLWKLVTASQGTAIAGDIKSARLLRCMGTVHSMNAAPNRENPAHSLAGCGALPQR